MMLGALLVFTTQGTRFNAKGDQVGECVNIIFFKIGKWMDLKSFELITIRKITTGNRVYSRSSYSTTVMDIGYDILLIDAMLTKIIKVNKEETLEEAIQYADEIAKELGMTQKPYQEILTERKEVFDRRR
jgi:hypothetical protein